MVIWKDNFDSFYSEVAELGRYDQLVLLTMNFECVYRKTGVYVYVGANDLLHTNSH